MYVLPKLPYKANALEPYISADTMRYHYGKHHAGYVKKLNELIKNTNLETLTLEILIRYMKGSSNPLDNETYNMAAQCYNHDFYWKSMHPSNEQPTGFLLDYIKMEYGTVDQLKNKFIDLASKQFGSGWIWLVQKRVSLDLILTHDADTIITNDSIRPLFVCDLWEHAYYLDYKNARERYVKNFFKIINWRFAESNLAI